MNANSPPPPTEIIRRLLSRVTTELASTLGTPGFIHLTASHATIDVMGGLASAEGSPHVDITLAPAFAIAARPRTDRLVRILSFDELDLQRPFTLDLRLDAANPLVALPLDDIKRGLQSPGAAFASPIVATLALLHHQQHIDLLDARIAGLDVALLSDVPNNPDLNPHRTAIHAALNILIQHLKIGDSMSPEHRHNLPVTIHRLFSRHTAPEAGEPPTRFEPPSGVRVVVIDLNVDPHPSACNDTLNARLDLLHQSASIAHALLLEQMRRMGREAGLDLISDPMQGQLARLDPEDYKRFFRNSLPETILGRDLLDRFPNATAHPHAIDPDIAYPLQPAADLFIFDARRTREFIRHISDARNATDPESRGLSLDKAGHLMYASHKNAADSALISSPPADRLVELLRAREPAGLYGARLAGTGRGIVVTLADETTQADQAIDDCIARLAHETGLSPRRIDSVHTQDPSVITHGIDPKD
jgi:hypothetical protein